MLRCFGLFCYVSAMSAKIQFFFSSFSIIIYSVLFPSMLFFASKKRAAQGTLFPILIMVKYLVAFIRKVAKLNILPSILH